MDYEKAYKAVLKTATQWIKDGCTDKEKICLECVFPELREIEDEKMITWLITQLKTNYKGNYWAGRAIEYLEKQKEQKPAEWSEEDKDKVAQYLHDRDGGMLWSKATEITSDILDMLHPSWKPSEEQMNCLCAAVDAAIRKHNESVSGYKPARVLKSLYEDLKKL